MSDDLQDNTSTSSSPATPKATKKKAATVVVVLLFLWGFWMAWKPEAKSSAQWKDKSIAPRVAELRQKLSAMEARPVNTVDDYITNTLETKPIVDEGRSLTEKQLSMIARFKQANSDDAGDMLAADYTVKLTEKDGQVLSLLANEIECAKSLQGLPANARLAYYNANVPPIKYKEEQPMKEWFAIAKDAKAKGVPLPAYVDQSASQR
jgi:hypothetical protein